MDDLDKSSNNFSSTCKYRCSYNISYDNVIEKYENDKTLSKIKLTSPVYNLNGKPYMLPVVQEVVRRFASDWRSHKEYLGPLGLPSFCEFATKLLLGNDSNTRIQNRCFSIQTISGTGGLRLLAEFLKKNLGMNNYYYRTADVKFHRQVFADTGFDNGYEFQYWTAQTPQRFDISVFDESINEHENGSAIIFYLCYNPEGVKPTIEQWSQIIDIITKKRVLPIFDCGYLGFETGDLEQEAAVIRYFAERELEFFAIHSLGESFTIYNSRIGHLLCVVNDPNCILNMKSQFIQLILASYKSPPSQGARIVTYILNNFDMYSEWKYQFKQMVRSINDMRKELTAYLKWLGTPGEWDHITRLNGMFTYLDITPEQITYLRKKHHIYILGSGLISMASVSPFNIERIARAIDEAIRKNPFRSVQN